MVRNIFCKFLCGLCITGLFISALNNPIAIASDISGYASLYDFEEFDVGTVVVKSSEPVGEVLKFNERNLTSIGPKTIEVDPLNPGNKCMLLNGTTTAAGVRIPFGEIDGWKGKAMSGRVCLEFRLYNAGKKQSTVTINQQNTIAEAANANKHTGSSTTSYTALTLSEVSDATVTEGASTISYLTGLTYKVKEWNTYTFILDTTTGKVEELWINGEKKASNHRSDQNNPYNSVGEISITTQQGGSLYFDDFCVYPADADVVKAVEADTDAGVFIPGKKVTLASESSDADIYYTTDGSLPNEDSTKYEDAILLEKAETVIKAVAIKDGEKSLIKSFGAYTLTAPSDIAVVDKKMAVSEGVVTASAKILKLADTNDEIYLLLGFYDSQGILQSMYYEKITDIKQAADWYEIEYEIPDVAKYANLYVCDNAFAPVTASERMDVDGGGTNE